MLPTECAPKSGRHRKSGAGAAHEIPPANELALTKWPGSLDQSEISSE